MPLMHPRHMQMPGIDTRLTGYRRRCRLFQLTQNPAGLAIADHLALGTQLAQLFLQGTQFVDAHLDMVDMFVDQAIGRRAVGLRCIAQGQQFADFLLGHIQRAAVADKRQALDMHLGVLPVVTFRARWFGQQAFAFVVTDGLHRAIGQACQLTNFHPASPEA